MFLSVAIWGEIEKARVEGLSSSEGSLCSRCFGLSKAAREKTPLFVCQSERFKVSRP